MVVALLGEALLVATSGAALGYGLAWAGLRALRSQAAETQAIPRLDAVVLDWRVAAVALAAALAAAVLAGLLPALEATRLDLTHALRDGNRGATSGRAGRVRRVLVVAEVALAVVLLSGSGLLIRSLVRLLEEHPGFTSSGVLTARVSLSGERYDDERDQGAARWQFYNRLVERLKSLPGVIDAGAVSYLPATGIGAGTSFVVVGRPAPAAGQEPSADIRIVSGDYFATIGIPLRQGRKFASTDTGTEASVVLVNEALAQAIFPGEDALGRELKIGWFGTGPDRIVGVVGDVRHESLETPARPTIYFPHPRSATRVMSLVVKTAGDPTALSRALTQQVQALDPSLPVSAIKSMDAVIADEVATRRLVMQMLTVFAFVALTLAGLGIYAVMAYSVAERRPELAIRMALGADAGRVLRLVMSHSAVTTLVGLAIGGAGAMAVTRLMAGLLYGIEPTDPVALAGALAILTLVALIASWLPGRAAAAVEPLQALHND
jgi:putative ABC transport system permease protein